jgi:tetratricopeptide (TPR) repeat protein
MQYYARLPLKPCLIMIRYAVFFTLLLLIISCEKHPLPTATKASSAGNSDTPITTPNSPGHYVGSEQCQSCHVAEQQDWLQSDHHKAMMSMGSNLVLGNFSAAPLKHHQQQTRFSRENGKYKIQTDQNTPLAVNLDLTYTFGIFPLQQYLTTLPDGRLQSLPFAWDSRPELAGGQRWYHLYENEKIIPGDVLHWRAPSHNANHMCIECHTTDFAKNYDIKNNSYQSTWKEIGVGCESCHGPGSNHVAWVQSTNKTKDVKKGWDVRLTSGALNLWQHQTVTAKPHRLEPGDTIQVERCAQCHSRRSRIDTSNSEKFLLDAFLPALLDETLYYPDGQIQDEVYEYGSFLQSKMANQGVTCSNCHNPHSGKTKIEGNGLCLQCHSSSYDASQHTMHQTGKNGSFCVDCHMPNTTYMAVDARRDHSMRIPRPDLTNSINTPNACSNCHTDKSSQWAAEKIDDYFGNKWRQPHYGEIIFKARLAQPSAYDALVELINNNHQPAIMRATAISLLTNFPSRDSLPLLGNMLGDAEPLIRLGALRAAEMLAPDQRKILLPLLQDQHLAIRIEAARLLAGNQEVQVDKDFQRVRQEYIESQQVNADRAPALTNLAGFAIREQRLQDAEELLLTAIKLEPYYIPASINLADLYRMSGRESGCEKIILDALKSAPDNPDLNLAYALYLVRNNDVDRATSYLLQSTRNSSDPHFHYVYALALQQQGKKAEALNVLDIASKAPMFSREVFMARTDISWEQGDKDRARKAIAEWEIIDPLDPAMLERKAIIRQQKYEH